MRTARTNKLKLETETIAKLDLNGVSGGFDPTDSQSSDRPITRPGMPSCWTCFHTHCCGPR